MLAPNFVPLWFFALTAFDTVDHARPYHGKPRMTFDAGTRAEVRRILGNVTPARAAEVAASRWACGPFLWVLEDVVRIDPPVPCRGFQKLWTVPTEITDVVRERYRAARSAA